MSNTVFLGKKSQIKNYVNKENKKVIIDSINPTKAGGILLSFPSRHDRDCVQTILNNKVSDLKLFPKLPSKILPKIEVSNIDGAIPSNQIINVLLEKNPELRSKFNTDNDVFELVFSKKDLYSNTQTAILRCSPGIRSTILRKGYLVIDCDRCPCKDHFFIFQCHHVVLLEIVIQDVLVRPMIPFAAFFVQP